MAQRTATPALRAAGPHEPAGGDAFVGESPAAAITCGYARGLTGRKSRVEGPGRRAYRASPSTRPRRELGARRARSPPAIRPMGARPTPKRSAHHAARPSEKTGRGTKVLAAGARVRGARAHVRHCPGASVFLKCGRPAEARHAPSLSAGHRGREVRSLSNRDLLQHNIAECPGERPADGASLPFAT